MKIQSLLLVMLTSSIAFGAAPKNPFAMSDAEVISLAKKLLSVQALSNTMSKNANETSTSSNHSSATSSSSSSSSSTNTPIPHASAAFTAANFASNKASSSAAISSSSSSAPYKKSFWNEFANEITVRKFYVILPRSLNDLCTTIHERPDNSLQIFSLEEGFKVQRNGSKYIVYVNGMPHYRISAEHYNYIEVEKSTSLVFKRIK